MASEPAPGDFSVSTADLPAHGRFRAWASRLSREVTTMEVVASRPASHHGEWRHFALGGKVDLNFFAAAPQLVTHRPAAAGPQRRRFQLIHMSAGEAVLRHDGERHHLREGQFSLLDDSVEWSLECLGESLCLTARLDRDWLRQWLAAPELLSGRGFAAAEGWGAPLAALLDTIARRGLDDPARPRPMIANQIGALTALMAGDEAVTASGRHSLGLFHRARRTMRESFRDQALAPTHVARALGISLRHLHGVFARHGTSFGSMLIDLRLEAARDMLGDPRHRASRIADIAWACGFTDPTHFARRCRERFGTLPRHMRPGP